MMEDGKGVMDDISMMMEDGKGVMDDKSTMMEDGKGVVGNNLMMMEDGKGVVGNNLMGYPDVGKCPEPRDIAINIISVFVLILPLFVGVRYTEDCPDEPMIPIWCIVHGSLALVNCVLRVILNFICSKNKTLLIGMTLLIRLIQMSYMIWAIVGGVYTYRNYPYTYFICNKTLYLFSFWYLNILFMIVFPIFCFCCCCCLKKN